MFFNKTKESIRLRSESESKSETKQVPAIDEETHSDTTVSGADRVAAPRRYKSLWGAFFARTAASCIDGAVLFVPLAILIVALLLPQIGAHGITKWHLVGMLVGAALACFTGIPGLALLLGLPGFIFLWEVWYVLLAVCFLTELGSWLYRAGFECSPWRATIGKRVMGFVVTLKDMRRAGFVRTSIRYFTKTINTFSLVLPVVGFWLNSGRMMHDRIAGCYVDGAPPIVPPLPAVPAPGVKFAPLWKRVCAAVIDTALVLTAEVCLSAISQICLYLLFQPTSPDEVLVSLLFGIPFYLVQVLMPMLFMALCEWSPLQATPGKILLDLQVTSPEGQRIKLLSSCYKQFVQYALWVNLWPLYIILTTIHVFGGVSWFPGHPYLLFASLLLVYGAMLCVTFRGQVKQSLVDRCAHRFVICKPPKNINRLISEQPHFLSSVKAICGAVLASFLLGSVLWYCWDLQPRNEIANRAINSIFFNGEPSEYYQWSGGWITANGQMIDPPTGVEVGSFSESLAPAKSSTDNEKWGYVDEQAKWVIKPQFDRVRNFHEGLAPAMVHRQWGLIDRHGHWVVKPQYDDVRPPSEGFSVARKGLNYGYINRNGKWLSKVQLIAALPFSNGFGAVCMPDGRWAYVHASGVISKPHRGYIRPFSEGLAAVQQDNRWGYINTAGKWAIPPQYEFAGPFQNGRAIVRDNKDQALLIDNQGHVLYTGKLLAGVYTPSVLSIPCFENGQYGFMDDAGHFASRPGLGGAQPYVNGKSFAYLKNDKVNDLTRRAMIQRLYSQYEDSEETGGETEN